MYQANEQTKQMISFVVEGYMVDHSWYHIIKRSSKTKSRTDSNAIILLSDIFDWHKPIHFIDPDTGDHSIFKKFKADLLQKSYAEIETQFGFTRDQARSAIETLESLGIAERFFRNEIINGQKVSSIMYIKFNNQRLFELMKSNKDMRKLGY